CRLAALDGAMDALGDAHPYLRVGVGVAGIVRYPDGEVEFAANHGHRRVKLARNLHQATGRRVIVENDANAAARSVAGTADAAEDGLLFLSIGTGLGSGFLQNGAVLRGHRGRGAELGHMVVDRASQHRCTCGLVGCLEALASGWALERDGRAAVAAEPRGALARRAGRQKVTTHFMIEAAREGDPDAVALVARMGAHIGRALGESVMSLLPVDRVVVGGGLAVLDRLLLDPMRGACQKALARSKCFHAPRFILSELGADAVMIGAAQLAWEADHEKAPAATAPPEPAPV
uniref:ROK family protein n=1 Tax=Pseudonocardia sp. TaxID=60912 RepID=UPI00260DF262